MDLNTIVQQYKVWNDTGAERELRKIKKLLSNVPVTLNAQACKDVLVTAELYEPQLSLPIFGCMSQEEADDIESRLETPFPLITIDLSGYSKSTAKKRAYQRRLSIKTEDARLLEESPQHKGFVYEHNGKYRLVEFFFV